MEHIDSESESANLREEAEEMRKKGAAQIVSRLTESAMKLVQELQVQKTELELMNDEFRVEKERAEAASKTAKATIDKYTELYDFAPFGYFTLSKEGNIVELNLMGAQLLGKERSRLINSRFGFFVTDDTRPAFNLFLKKVFTGKSKVSCEITLLFNDSLPMNVYIEGLAAKNIEQCILSVVDITEQTRMKAEKETLLYNLNERVKELQCLYRISSIVEIPNISFSEMMQQIVEEIRSGWQFPDITCARIVIDMDDYKTANYKETKWKQSSKIKVNSKEAGRVEVFYLEERAESDEGPFLKEEKTLINAIAQRLGHITEGYKAEEQIKQTENRLKSLVEILQYESNTIQEFLDYALHEAIDLTLSKIGYIYHYSEAKKEFILNSWSREVMKECTIVEAHTVYELDKTGLWGEAVRQRKPIIVNDFQSPNPLKKGYPEGHSHLNKYLTVPIFRGVEIVGVVAVGNKETDYIESDVIQLSLLMESVWKVVDRKQAAEDLRESNERHRIFIEQSPIAIELYNSKGLLVSVNQACIELFGVIDANELMGFSLFDDPNISDEHKNELRLGKNIRYQAVFDFDKVKKLNLYQTIKSGQIFIDTIITPIKDSREKISEYLLQIQDITEQKRDESYSEMGREVLQILNESGPLQGAIQRVLNALKTGTGFDAVGIRLKEGDDYPYMVQEGFSNSFLMSENTLVERDANGGVCRDSSGNISLECTCGLVILGKTDPANSLFTRGGSSWTNDSFPFLKVPADQDPRHHPRNVCIHQGYASVALVPIRMKEKIVGLLQFNDRGKGRFSLAAIEQLESIAVHLGEALTRKQAEEEIRLKNEQIIALNSEEISVKNSQLQELNASKDKLFSIIAHDLRSPFTGLLGLSEIMASESDSFSSAEIAKFSSSLHTSIVNVYKLIENLLEWAQFQKGLIPFTPVELCLLDVYLESKESIKQRALQKGITIINEIPETYKIFADENMIDSVLRNLLSNAVKFTSNGGKVIGKAREVEDGMIEISVTDTGVGIPADTVDKLFKIGENVGTTGTDNEPSTGLGLLLCKEFVEKHSGKIWVESEDGKGSTFFFTLPKIC